MIKRCIFNLVYKTTLFFKEIKQAEYSFSQVTALIDTFH